jgi:hypothetical protein
MVAVHSDGDRSIGLLILYMDGNIMFGNIGQSSKTFDSKIIFEQHGKPICKRSFKLKTED